MIHCMIDMETLGTRYDCAILSVAAVLFDAEDIRKGTCYQVAPDEKDVIDWRTVLWWMAQSDSARGALVSTERFPMRTMLEELCAFYLESQAQFVWSHGSLFDIAILEYKYRQHGIRVPWDFRQVRDTRTLLWYTGKKIPKIEDRHDALADATLQAQIIIECLRNMGER